MTVGALAVPAPGAGLAHRQAGGTVSRGFAGPVPLAGAGALAAGVMVAGYAPGALMLYQLALLGSLVLATPLFVARPSRLLVLLGAWLPAGLLGRLDYGAGVPVIHSVLHLVGVLAAGAFAANRLLTGGRLRITAPLLAIMVFVVMALVFAPLGVSPGDSLAVLARYYVPFLVLVFLAVNTIDDLATLRDVYAAVCLGMAVTAVSLLLMRLGLLQIEGVLQNFQGRLGSFGGGMASTSLYLVIASGLCLAMIRTSRGRARTAWVVVLAALVTGSFLTYSLTGLTALLVLVAAAQIPVRGGLWKSVRTLAGRSLPAVILVAVALASLSPLLMARIRGKWVDLATSSVYYWGSGRVGLAIAGVRMIGDHALTGVGVGNAGRALVRYLDEVPVVYEIPVKGDELIKVPDNTIVELASEAGVPLALFFVLTLALTGRRLLRALRRARPSPDDHLGHTLLAMFAAAAAFSLFNDVMADKFFWFAIALLVTAERLLRIAAGPTAASGRPSSPDLLSPDAAVPHREP